MTTKIALFSGSFDPVTTGHIDIANRALSLFDKLIIGVFRNPAKSPLFTVEERKQQLEQIFTNDTRVEVVVFSGLLVEFAKVHQIVAIVRGIRDGGDVTHEMNMAQMNRALATSIETVFLPTSPEVSYVSSSLVKDVAKHGGDVQAFVPPSIYQAMREKLT